MGRNTISERISRHKPVSCVFCRSRKLRCSRQIPCSNCTTRGVACNIDGPVARVARTAAKDVTATDHGYDADVLRRLRKLESAVFKHSETRTPDTIDHGSYSAEPQPSSGYPEEEPTAMDVQQLERECMDLSSPKSFYAESLIFGICSVRQVIKCDFTPILDPTALNQPAKWTKRIWLPMYDEAQILLGKYLDDNSWLHPVYHIQRLYDLLDQVYNDINKRTNVKVGQVALLLSFFASTTYLWTSYDTIPRPLFATVEEANSQCIPWLNAALDVLEYSRRTTSGAIEDIQAMIILFLVVGNVEGMSARFRYLISTAIVLARQLSLHRIDHPRRRALPMSLSSDPISLEIGRRIWWCLAATDWFLSRYPASQEGVYTISVHQMAVRKPMNLSDEDLSNHSHNLDSAGLSLSEPTNISYLLQRMEFAQICREITDYENIYASGSGTLTHSAIMELDKKFEHFLRQIPAFLSLQDEPVREATNADLRQVHGIMLQRYNLNSMVYSHRCKLHVSFLAKGYTDPLYARSRDICLDSARMLIRMERILGTHKLPYTAARLKFCGVLYSIFLAVIVLLADFCFTKGNKDDEEIRADVVVAYKMMQEASLKSAAAAKLMEALLRFFSKHQEATSLLNELMVDNVTSTNANAAFVSAGVIGTEYSTGADGTVPIAPTMSYSDDFFDTLTLDTMDYQAFFSELESCFP